MHQLVVVEFRLYQRAIQIKYGDFARALRVEIDAMKTRAMGTERGQPLKVSRFHFAGGFGFGEEWMDSANR